MAISECPECKGQVSDTAAACPHCGAKQKQGSGLWKWVLGVPVVLFVAMMIIGGLSSDDGKGLERDTINLCWKDQERKVFDPETARFIARACEKLEADFLKKHGHRP
jgi:hypothetical protein